MVLGFYLLGHSRWLRSPPWPPSMAPDFGLPPLWAPWVVPTFYLLGHPGRLWISGSFSPLDGWGLWVSTSLDTLDGWRLLSLAPSTSPGLQLLGRVVRWLAGGSCAQLSAPGRAGPGPRLAELLDRWQAGSLPGTGLHFHALPLAQLCLGALVIRAPLFRFGDVGWHVGQEAANGQAVAMATP